MNIQKIFRDTSLATLTFSKAQRRAYKDTIRDIKAMDEGKQVGKHKITLDQGIIRYRIRKALLEVEGVKKTTAAEWADKIYQRAQNFLEDRRKFVLAKAIYERITLAHPGATKEQIDEMFAVVYNGSMKKTEKVVTPKPAFSPEVAQVRTARKAERNRLKKQNAHLRAGDSMSKKKKRRA